MLKRLYNWTMSLAQTRHALWLLALISAVEASIFPIPPDALMIPMILARPKRAFFIAGVTTLASVAGGVLGYFIGVYLYDKVGVPVLEFYGKTDAFDVFQTFYNKYGAVVLLFSGITPFPFKVTTILSGATGLNLATFIIFTLIGRGIRFFTVAALLWRFGEPIRDFIEKRLGTVFTIALLLLLGGFVVVWAI